MAKAYDIPANHLIIRLAEQLKKDKKIESPAGRILKTGSHVEKIPQNKDWWYVRCASLVRKVYMMWTSRSFGPEKCTVAGNA